MTPREQFGEDLRFLLTGNEVYSRRYWQQELDLTEEEMDRLLFGQRLPDVTHLLVIRSRIRSHPAPEPMSAEIQMRLDRLLSQPVITLMDTTFPAPEGAVDGRTAIARGLFEGLAAALMTLPTERLEKTLPVMNAMLEALFQAPEWPSAEE